MEVSDKENTLGTSTARSQSCERVSAVWNGLSEDSNSGSLACFKNSILAIDFTAHLKCF